MNLNLSLIQLCLLSRTLLITQFASKDDEHGALRALLSSDSADHSIQVSFGTKQEPALKLLVRHVLAKVERRLVRDFQTCQNILFERTLNKSTYRQN